MWVYSKIKYQAISFLFPGDSADIYRGVSGKSLLFVAHRLLCFDDDLKMFLTCLSNFLTLNEIHFTFSSTFFCIN